MLTANEAAAVQRARNAGEHWRANILIAQARGRWVEAEVRAQFSQLQWSRTGADVLDPATGLSYDIMSGTASNMALHGRRMASEFFRMITF